MVSVQVAKARRPFLRWKRAARREEGARGERPAAFRAVPRGGQCTMEVCGWRTPEAVRKKALAVPKFRFMSSRTGRWLASSVM